MESSDEEHNIYIPMEILESAESAKLELLPTKSKKLYEKTYNEFIKWRNENNVKVITEDILLGYFFEKSKNRKPSSLWSYYSMLKSTLNLYNNINISKFPKLIAFLKRKNDGYKPKKSKILNRDEIELFLKEAPDNVYLMMKVCYTYLYLLSN